MKKNRIFAILGLGLAALSSPMPNATYAWAADANETTKNILAVQIRKQGYDCADAKSATRGPEADDDATWILDCGDYRYKVRLVPNMAAHVEQLPSDAKKATNP